MVQCTLIRQYSHWWMSQGAAVRQETAVEAELPAGSLGLQSISLRQHSFSQLSEKDNPNCYFSVVYVTNYVPKCNK